jgi:CRISPR-associated protein Csb2
MFQALVAAAARLDGGTVSARSEMALEWLERLPPPIILAPHPLPSSGYRLSVPNNAMDIVARAWSRGNESNTGDANPATHRTMKELRPHWLGSGNAVHYVWNATGDEAADPAAVLSDLASGLAALGWGLDLAIGQAYLGSDEDIDGLQGERWRPVAGGQSEALRVPVAGTLLALIGRHRRFLSRVTAGGLTPPPALRQFGIVKYRREMDPPDLPFAAFSLLTPDLARWRPFDAVRRGLTLAGMARHAARRAAERAGWQEGRIDAVVLGHTPGENGQHLPVGPARFAYWPLPSIERRKEDWREVAGAIRRVLVVSFDPSRRADVEWAARALSGEDLIDEATGEVPAVLSLLPRSETMVARYTEPAATWTSVTPVVLPGYDDPSQYRRRLRAGRSAEVQRELLAKIDRRVDGLLRKAIVQAGFAPALAEHAMVDWRATGFLPGVDRADRYGVPDHLRRFPRLHVRIEWRDAAGGRIRLRGPMCIGGGRFLGLGLLVPVR